MHLKQKHSHLRVVLSVGGPQSAEVFPIVASDTILRDNFARSARGLVEASGLDGIDSKMQSFLSHLFFTVPLIMSCQFLVSLASTRHTLHPFHSRASALSLGVANRGVKYEVSRSPVLTFFFCLVVWEYPCNEQQGADFLALLAAIRIHLPDDCYLLTAALPAPKNILQLIDLGHAVDYLDFINLTAYDFYGSWTARTGHQAQLYAMNRDETSASSGVSYLISAGVPGKKILLGIPVFGRSFLQATGPGQKFRGAGGEDGSFEYKDLPRKGVKEQVDKRSVAAQCIGGDGGFVTYDNPDTVKMKAAFCKQKGLGVSAKPLCGGTSKWPKKPSSFSSLSPSHPPSLTLSFSLLPTHLFPSLPLIRPYQILFARSLPSFPRSHSGFLTLDSFPSFLTTHSHPASPDPSAG